MVFACKIFRYHQLDYLLVNHISGQQHSRQHHVLEQYVLALYLHQLLRAHYKQLVWYGHQMDVLTREG